MTFICKIKYVHFNFILEYGTRSPLLFLNKNLTTGDVGGLRMKLAITANSTRISPDRSKVGVKNEWSSFDEYHGEKRKFFLVSYKLSLIHKPLVCFHSVILLLIIWDSKLFFCFISRQSLHQIIFSLIPSTV